MLVCSLLVAVWIAVIVPAHAADPQFPQLTGRVVDGAGLLSTEDIAQITADLEALETKSSDQLVVITLKSLQGFEIEEFGYKLGRHWGIGQKNKDNGVLLIVAPNERKVRIEVGRRLEALLTDAISRIIIENGILPRFRDRDFPGGIKTGVSDIIAVLTGHAEELKMRSMAETRRDGFEDMIISIIILLIWTFIIFAVIWSIGRQIRHGTSSSSSSGKKSSGGSWSSGGGGFSGGGGSFGGGGSSGGW